MDFRPENQRWILLKSLYIQRLAYLFVLSLIEICADKIAILVNPLIYVQLTCATNNQFMPSYFDLSIRQVLSTKSFCDLIIKECSG